MNCGSCVFWKPNQEVPEQSEDGKYECLHPDVPIRTRIDFGCAYHLGQNSTEANVPNHTRYGTMTDPNPNPVDGPTEILIATFGTPTKRCSGAVVSDLDWLRYCLRAIRKFCTGFQGVTVVHPAHETQMFEPLRDELDIRLSAQTEQPGKGFLHHMIAMASADQIVPPSTKYVLHCDADCIFNMATTPENFFWGDKPYYIVRSWESLVNPVNRVISDCAQWREPTEVQLGMATP